MSKPPPDQNPVPLPPVARKSTESGLITESAVSENRRPESSVSESTNFNFDTIGSAIVRPGITSLGNSLGAAVNGLAYFIDTVAPVQYTQLVAAAGANVYYLSGTTWTSIRTGLTSGQKCRFVSFLNFLFMVNGTESTVVWDGNPAGSFVTTGNALNAPIGTVIEAFQNRMWIAGNPTYPDNLYYSAPISSAVPQVITWNTDPITGLWLAVSSNDGENITALHRTRNTLIIFKQNHLYRLYGVSNIDPDAYYAVGTYSQESVLETKAGMYFHHSSGFYSYNVYGVVQEISRPIIDIIKAIPASAWPNVVGWGDPDGDHINWSIGTVTYGGVTYPNMVVRYSISTQVWTHRTYPNQITNAVGRWPLYTDGTNQFGIIGDSAGTISKYNLGTSDNGVPISVSIVHRWDNIDGLLSTRKNVQTVLFTHIGGAGLRVQYQTETSDRGIDQPSDWSKPIGTLKAMDTGFPSVDIKARKMRFRISGQVNGPFIYNGYELLMVTNEYVQFVNNS